MQPHSLRNSCHPSSLHSIYQPLIQRITECPSGIKFFKLRILFLPEVSKIRPQWWGKNDLETLIQFKESEQDRRSTIQSFSFVASYILKL